MRSTRLALPFTLLALIVASPRPALACSSPCPEPMRLWGGATSIPGNLVYFEVYASIFDETYAPFALRTAEDEPIAASLRTIEGDLVFAPDEPIAAGTRVVLEYDYGCGGSDQPLERRTFAFTTTESVQDAPAQPPAPTVARRGFIEGPEACDMAFVDLELGSVDLDGLGALTDLAVTVDGEQGWYGPASELSSALLSLDSHCDGGDYGLDYWHSSCGDLFRLPPGKHTMEVRSLIVGFPDPEPVRYEFEVQCAPGCPMAPDAAADPEPTAPEDASGGADEAPGGPPGDVVSSEGEAGDETRESSRIQIGGCTVRRGGRGGWLTMLALPWILRRRRRTARG
jgi:hypothetical protein